MAPRPGVEDLGSPQITNGRGTQKMGENARNIALT